MDKFSELKAAAMAATPGPWKRTITRFNGITNSTHSMASFSAEGVLANANEKRDAIFIAAANPAAVLELLAELEAKDKRIAELEAIATDYAGKFQKAQDANKHLIIMSNDDKRRIADLEAEGKVWASAATKHLARAEEAEQRLSTPVRLPALLHPESDAVNGMIFANGRNEAIAECSVAIRQAGFLSEASPMTVAGDE
ncbi:ead/Ea22-like family protein [Serratia sp. CY58181]|uniref:ead/Ea22-like family protein n=1 Tax=Serratia TaxID=613 RepID=UPI003980800C